MWSAGIGTEGDREDLLAQATRREKQKDTPSAAALERSSGGWRVKRVERNGASRVGATVVAGMAARTSWRYEREKEGSSRAAHGCLHARLAATRAAHVHGYWRSTTAAAGRTRLCLRTGEREAAADARARGGGGGARKRRVRGGRSRRYSARRVAS
ncbi:hypothetical protein FGB62_157g015 [Gracilaria domingensis]|nr:hypothetical protein FGB62_157g015 [Gracilaria domingensis]